MIYNISNYGSGSGSGSVIHLCHEGVEKDDSFGAADAVKIGVGVAGTFRPVDSVDLRKGELHSPRQGLDFGHKFALF